MEFQELNVSNLDGTFSKGQSTCENSLTTIGHEKQQHDSHYIDIEVTSGNSRNQASTHLDVNTESVVYHENSRNTDKNGTAVVDVKFRNVILERFGHFKRLFGEIKPHVFLALKICVLIAYFVYFGFALAHHEGDEGSWRLIACTVFGVLLFAWRKFKKTKNYKKVKSLMRALLSRVHKSRKVIRWVLYVAMTVFMTVYVIVMVAIRTPENLRSLFGLAAFPFLLFVTSNNRRKVNWHAVYWGMSLQFIMALIILKTPWGASIIEWFGTRLTNLIHNAEAGSIFMFGEKYKDHNFVFGALVQGVVLIITMSVLNYLGVIKFVVESAGRVLAFGLGISPAEGINAMGNIFLHVPESAMLIQEYIAEMTPSQLFMTYASGMATVGGTSLVIFMASGVPAGPLIAASAMSAPAAISACKLSFPSHEKEEMSSNDDIINSRLRDTTGFLEKPKSLMHSIIIGINQSVVLTCQAVFYIMTFIIILEWVNNTLIWFGDRIGVENMTAEFLLSYIFYPFAFMMGARPEDCLFIGQLLGIRTFSLAVVAYPKLGPIIVNGREYRSYIAAGENNTWTQVGNDIYLDNLNKTLIGGVIDPRSEIIATYALCGSASFAVMGLIIGSFEAIVPSRIGEITHNILRAMIVGTVASYLTACFAGLLFEEKISV